MSVGYMEKRGSGLKRICNETRNLESYKEDKKPKFKSSSSHFITTIYSMEYEREGTSEEQVEGTSRGQVRGQVLRLIKVLNKEDLPVRMLMEKLELHSRDKFLKNYLTPALEAGLVKMTQPNSAKSPTQQYMLTQEGRKLLE